MLKFEKVTKQNVVAAIRVQNSIFPSKHADAYIYNTIDGHPLPWVAWEELWLAKVDEEVIGITGLWTLNGCPKDAWIDWFGVVEQHRRKGFATQMFNFIKKTAQQLGFENLRVWTDDKDNSESVAFYQKQCMDIEIYANKDDVHLQKGNTVILSLGLNEEVAPKWENKNLHLKQLYQTLENHDPTCYSDKIPPS